MAIFTNGPLAGAISGTLGAVNFAATKAGSVIRRRPSRTNKQTQDQHDRRTNFELTSRTWFSLDPEIRDAWNAATKQFRFTNRLGARIIPSGFQLFMKAYLDKFFSGYYVNLLPPVLGQLESPIITADFTVGGPYNITYVDWNPDYFTYFPRLSISRPISSKPRRHYPAYKFALKIDANLATLDVYSKIVPVVGELRDTERVSLRLYLTHVFAFPSKPFFLEVTVHA